MINAIIDWSIKNRVIVLLMTVVFFGVGIYVINQMPVDAIPDLSDVQVIVRTPYQGQAPQVVEDQVTYPLTTAMLAVPKAVSVRGFSFFGDSYVYIIFKEGTDLYWARSRVLEYLNQVANKLPPNVRPQLGPDATGVGWVYEYALIDKTGQHDLSELRSLQDWFLKFELQSVPGVAEVASVGGMVKQYQVVLDPNRLRAYGFSLDKVKQAVLKSNTEVGGSVVEMAEAEYMVRSSGYIQSKKDIGDIPLDLNDNGTPILLKDIARINTGPQIRRGIADLNGQGEVAGGIIVMRFGENAEKVISRVKEKLEALKKSLPKGVEIVTTYDRSHLIARAISTLKEKLLIEFIIVSLICALFLMHFRSSLIVIVSLPLGILLAFIIMYVQGINANIMSLGGIAIAIGAMVDASIVMIENVHKHLARYNGNDHWQAVARAVKEVGSPLFFSLLIITLSFMPVFALQGQEGRLFSPLAFTKTYSMATSAVLAITLVPVLLGVFIRGKVHSTMADRLNDILKKMYRPIIKFILSLPKITLLLALVISVLSLWPLKKIGSEFMPDLDEGDLMYMPTTFPALSIGKAQQLLQQTDRLIRTLPEVKTVFGKIGRAETATDPAPLTMIETVIQFNPKSTWRAGMTTQKIIQQLDEKVQVPGVTNAWVMPIKTRIDMLATGIKTPLGIKITGPDLKQIQKIGKDIEAVLKPIQGTASVYSERVAGGRYININIDRERAARFGLLVSDVQDVVSSAIGGMNVTETVEGLERYPVNIRYPQTVRDSLEKLRLLPIVTPLGASIPLADVATVRITQGAPMVKSENARPMGQVLVDIQGRDLGNYIQEAQQIVSKKLQLPAGYALTWSGQYEYMQRAKARLQLLIPLTLLIIVLLLYLNFHRLFDVFLILLTLPFALIGGVWLLYLLGFHFSVAVGVGFIALAGVSVEIGILMVVYLNDALKSLSGSFNLGELRQAIIAGALERIRPIIMTVTAIVAGLLPILLGSGTGSEVMRRIAAPMVGGMLTSTVLTLVLIPAVFYLWHSRSVRAN